MKPFRTRLKALADTRGGLCVGVDPHPHLVTTWGFDDDVHGMERCARTLVEHIGDKVAVFKPQSAFFERFGSGGIAVLERVLADIAQQGALSVLDVKRGDIGSTMAAYATAYLADGSPLAADAVTLNPYLGVGALEPALTEAEATGRGVYLLCRTSNPEGDSVQSAQAEGVSVAQHVVDLASDRNHASGQHAVGLVIGATNAELDVDLSRFTGSILVPGIGAQGGVMSDLARLFGTRRGMALPTLSRSIMFAGPDRDDLRTAVDRTLAELS